MLKIIAVWLILTAIVSVVLIDFENMAWKHILMFLIFSGIAGILLTIFVVLF